MTVDFTRENALGHLRLNRPEHGNALSLRMAEDLHAVAVRCASDDRLRALLITGSGARFSVGGDIAEFAQAGPGELGTVMQRMARVYHDAIEVLAALRVPVVCGVHGAVAGGALGLTYVADLVLAAESTRFALGFAAIGIAGDSANSWFLPRLVGPRRAAELYFEQRVLTATEAVDWGLATRVVPDAQLAAEALAVAGRLAAGPTIAYGLQRGLLRRTGDNDLPAQLAAEVDALGIAGATADAAEGVAAFRTRRTPDFGGS